MSTEDLQFHVAGNSDIVRAVDNARAHGKQVVLLLPPRSPRAEQLMPDGQPEELRRRAQALAAELDVPLFAPRVGWNETDFVDRAHMSLEGREHFLRELREWWAARP